MTPTQCNALKKKRVLHNIDRENRTKIDPQIKEGKPRRNKDSSSSHLFPSPIHGPSVLAEKVVACGFQRVVGS